jgi:hypothetical protein
VRASYRRGSGKKRAGINRELKRGNQCGGSVTGVVNARKKNLTGGVHGQ